MNLKKYIPFVAIALYLGFLNLLFILDNTFLGLRNPLVAVFLMTMPGYLIHRLLNTHKDYFWKTACYVVGLSTAYLIILGLVTDLIGLDYLNFKGLERWPLLIAVDVTCGLLILNNLIRCFLNNSVDDIHTITPKRSFLNVILYGVALLFPILSLIGALQLNNGGSNYFLLASLMMIAVYFIFTVFIAKHLDDGIMPYSIFMISLAVLLQSSMRGWNVTGTDILREFHMFNQVNSSGYWTANLIHHSYNSCLSITILPTFLAKFIDVEIQYIFKFVMQFMFAFTPVVVYFFVLKFGNKVIAYLSSFFYLSFPIFIYSMTMHVRQEFAFLFFSLIFLAFFDDNISAAYRRWSAFIFGFCMVVSHYSTTYLALFIFGFWYASNLVLNLLFKSTWLKKLVFRKYDESFKPFTKSRISLAFVVFIVTTAFLWYSQVVHIDRNIIVFGSKVVSNLANIFNNDSRPDQTSLFNQFNLFYKPASETPGVAEYYKQMNKRPGAEIDQNFYDKSTYQDYFPQITLPAIVPLHIPASWRVPVYFSFELVKKIEKFLIILGVLILIVNFVRKKNIDPDFLLISGACLTLTLMFIVLPFFSIDYDILRATQQFLIFFSFTSIFAFDKVLFFLRKLPRVKYGILSLFVVMYFLIYTSVIYQMVGGSEPAYTFANYGAGYERSVVTDPEVKSAQWLEREGKLNYLIQADTDSQSRLYMSTLKPMAFFDNLMPAAIYRSGYIYLNNVNVKQKVFYTSFNGEPFRLTIPYDFYNANKNLIYSNGSSEIYK